MYMHPVWVPHLLHGTPGCSPRLLPFGQLNSGQRTVGAAGQTGHQGAEKRGEEVGEREESSNLRRPGPPLGAVCWATLSRRSPLLLLKNQTKPVHHERYPPTHILSLHGNPPPPL